MEYVVTNADVELAVDDVGAGPIVLLLHGWPDTAALWDEMIPLLVAAGYRCVSVDLRGCGRSSKPEALNRYRMFELVGDVCAVVDALDAGPVALLGHDWGAALAWAAASAHPERFTSLVALSVGHPSAFRGAGLAQQIRSWYALLFWHEGLGEAFLRRHDYEALRTWLAHPRPDALIAELERDGQMSAHLRWYRANLPPDAFVRDAPRLAPLAVAALGIWSSGDRALVEEQMRDSGRYCAAGFTYVRLEGVGHWLPLEAPREVVHEVVKFLPVSGVERGSK